MSRWRIALFVLVLFMLGGWVGFLSTPVASSDPGSILAAAPDSQVAGFVTSSYTPQSYGGDGTSLESAYNLIPDGYNRSATDEVLGSLEDTAQGEIYDINPWTFFPALVMSTAGVYIGYKTQSLWFHWLSNQWGTNAGSVLVSPEWVPVHANVPVCVGESPSGGTVNLVSSTDGYIFEASAGSGWCGPGDGPVSWDGVAPHVWVSGQSTNLISESTIANDLGTGPTVSLGVKLQFMSGNAQVWFRSSALGVPAAGFLVDGVSPTSLPTTLNCTGTGYEGLGCTGSTFTNGNPTTSAIANEFRTVLGEPQYSDAQKTFACVVAGNCTTTPVSPSYTMPDCWAFTVADCESMVTAAAAAVNDNAPTFSTTILDSSSADTNMMPSAVLGQDVAAGTFDHPDSLDLTANPDPLNDFSSSAGYGGANGGGGDSTTTSDPHECDWHDYGSPPFWKDSYNLYPDFYQAACDEAWEDAITAGLVDAASGQPTGWVDTAEIAIRGKYFTNPSLIDALESDGSNVTDWAKIRSPEFNTANGPAEIHVYKNVATGNIYTGMDFKVVFDNIFYPG